MEIRFRLCKVATNLVAAFTSLIYMMRLAEIFVAGHVISGLILFLWVFWLRRNDSNIWRCPKCESEFCLLHQEFEPRSSKDPAYEADLQCPECLACFDFWHPPVPPYKRFPGLPQSASVASANCSLIP